MLEKVDYKGKWFILQDKIDPAWDYSLGKMDKKDLTDEFLFEHVENCFYYGIPAYIGSDEELLKRIDNMQYRLYEKRESQSE